jgi:hypothetical protein
VIHGTSLGGRQTVAALDCCKVRSTVGQWLEVVAAVFEGDAALALELVMVPFCEFGVSEQGVVTTEEASFKAGLNTIAGI